MSTRYAGRCMYRLNTHLYHLSVNSTNLILIKTHLCEMHSKGVATLTNNTPPPTFPFNISSSLFLDFRRVTSASYANSGINDPKFSQIQHENAPTFNGIHNFRVWFVHPYSRLCAFYSRICQQAGTADMSVRFMWNSFSRIISSFSVVWQQIRPNCYVCWYAASFFLNWKWGALIFMQYQ